MNKIYYLIMAFTTLVSFVSCGNDGELDSKSIFPDGVDTSTQNYGAQNEAYKFG